MSQPPPPSDNDPKAQRRNKLVGRLMVLGLVALILVYVVPVLISRFG